MDGCCRNHVSLSGVAIGTPIPGDPVSTTTSMDCSQGRGEQIKGVCDKEVRVSITRCETSRRRERAYGASGNEAMGRGTRS
jgi:hypothetical protein